METSIFIINNKHMITLVSTTEQFEVFYLGQEYKVIKETNHNSVNDTEFSVYYDDGEEVLDEFTYEEVVAFLEEQF